MPDLESEALDFRAASESFAPMRKIGRRDLEFSKKYLLRFGISPAAWRESSDP